MTEGFNKLNERIAALEAASAARAQERAKGTAKGGDFEATSSRLLADVARGAGDTLDVTATETAPSSARRRATSSSRSTRPHRGAELRVVVEAKDRAMSGRAMRDELREAKTNRGAAIGLVVFSPAHAPTGIAPFDVRAGDVYCVVVPGAPDRPRSRRPSGSPGSSRSRPCVSRKSRSTPRRSAPR